MKKIITVLLIMAVILCGCGNEGKESSNDLKQNETENDSSELENDDSDENEETEDMSQAEWIESGGADNMEDGYEKVESINIDSDEAILKYEGYEIVEENSSDESGEMKPNIVLYFEFENKNGTRSADSTFNVSVFQNGIKSINWLGGASNVDGNEPIKDWRTETLSGGKLKVGLEFELQDLENPIKIRVDNQKYQESSPLLFQQQELEIKDIKIEENTESIESIILSDGEEGEYGQYDSFDGETYLRFYVPIGSYTVKCKKEGGFYIESIEKHKEDGFETTDVIQQINMSEGEEREISIEEGQCIFLFINTEIELIRK